MVITNKLLKKCKGMKLFSYYKISFGHSLPKVVLV